MTLICNAESSIPDHMKYNQNDPIINFIIGNPCRSVTNSTEKKPVRILCPCCGAKSIKAPFITHTPSESFCFNFNYSGLRYPLKLAGTKKMLFLFVLSHIVAIGRNWTQLVVLHRHISTATLMSMSPMCFSATTIIHWNVQYSWMEQLQPYITTSTKIIVWNCVVALSSYIPRIYIYKIMCSICDFLVDTHRNC